MLPFLLGKQFHKFSLTLKWFSCFIWFLISMKTILIISKQWNFGINSCKINWVLVGAQHQWYFFHWLIDCYVWLICFVTHAIILCLFTNICFQWSNQLITQVHFLSLLFMQLFLDRYSFGIHVWSINCHTYFSLINRNPFLGA